MNYKFNVKSGTTTAPNKPKFVTTRPVAKDEKVTKVEKKPRPKKTVEEVVEQ